VKLLAKFCAAFWFWCYLVLLALTLFVARVVANNHDATMATNNFALVANLFDAWVNLHDLFLFICSDK
jgi:hypothetical protein